MKEIETIEQRLKDKVGRDNPFRTPDGYFDTLTERIMQQLPHDEAAQSRSERAKMDVASATKMDVASATKMDVASATKMDVASANAPRQKRTFSLKPFLRYSAAAVIVVAVAAGTLLYVNHEPDTDTATGTTASATYSESIDYMNDALDYALVDNEEIEMYLTDNR